MSEPKSILPRQEVLDVLHGLKKHCNGFAKGAQRWGSFFTGVDHIHLSDIVFEELDDEHLEGLLKTIMEKYLLITGYKKP
jgi:hypothetical protein